MRPTPIPDDEVWPDAIRTTIAPPGGDFFDPDISAVEALVETGGTRVNRYSVRLVPEGDDLARLNRGDPLWLTINCHQLPVFAVGFAVQSIATGRCRNCGKTLVRPFMGRHEDFAPTDVVFHQYPADDPPCPSGPEIEWVEADPPTMTTPQSWMDLQTVIGERCEELFGPTIEGQGLALAEEAAEVLAVAAGRAGRAILKRREGIRRTPEEWSAELRKETAQVVAVAATIAHLEGFDLMDAVEEAAESLLTYVVDRRAEDGA